MGKIERPLAVKLPSLRKRRPLPRCLFHEMQSDREGHRRFLKQSRQRRRPTKNYRFRSEISLILPPGQSRILLDAGDDWFSQCPACFRAKSAPMPMMPLCDGIK